MKYKGLLTLISIILMISSATAQKIEFYVEGAKDTIVNMAKYYGSKLYYADTSEFKNSKVSFDAAKHEPGVYALIVPGKGYFEFIINNDEAISMETNANNFIEHIKVNRSKENTGFYEFIKFMNEKRSKGKEIREELEQDPQNKKLKSKMESLSDEVEDFQNQFQKKYEGTLVAKLMKITQEVKTDPAELEKMDSLQRYHNYLNTYFDHVDFTDDRLVKSPIYHNKLDNFFSEKTLVQNPDSIIKYCDKIIGQTEEGSEMFKYTLHHVTYKYETSKVMGMDKVFAHLGNKYYCPDPVTGESKAFWLDEEKQKKICERARKITPLLIGQESPNIILTDSTEENWVNVHQLPNKYKVLYFWDPNCGHCKKSTPKLNELYKDKLKHLGIEVVAIGKAMGDDFEDWKKFIRENELEFINIGLTKNIYNIAMENARELVPKYTTVESLNYSDTYDVYSTPKVFIIDEENKFVAKQLSVEQIGEFFDKVMAIEEDVKHEK